ncbi:MAG: tRNA (N6-threonylcarbamoyladenosine(37)-N6)-methyltransferase TrmO [Clostridia bacterium]|nr:tRNA (N6-threonylcarbamoyladenosine(37)-N6)-methyltransferase TrmO [Clostridia bacterium]
MSKKVEVQVIGHIYNAYKEKFGIPRQSGLTKNVISKIVFEKEFSSKEFFKGLEQFTHIWLLWQFSETLGKDITPTVRPPKLGGNEHIGVFATRSPFRPNNIGLSSVKIEKIDFDEKAGTVIYVSGADLMNGTPIYDIKPYLPYIDIHDDASNGFALSDSNGLLDVKCSEEILSKIPLDLVDGLFESLKHDPRPSYQNDKERVYGMSYGDLQVKFKVDGNELEIVEII